LKSANILLGEDWHVSVCDFGTSRAYLTQLDEREKANLVGTTAWMAPEMFGEQGYNEKADVYSFSMVLCELLTRKPPFHGTKTWAIPNKVIAGERPRISYDLPTEPKGFSVAKALCKLCWHQTPNKRPTFAAILAKLEPLLKAATDDAVVPPPSLQRVLSAKADGLLMPAM